MTFWRRLGVLFPLVNILRSLFFIKVNVLRVILCRAQVIPCKSPGSTFWDGFLA